MGSESRRSNCSSLLKKESLGETGVWLWFAPNPRSGRGPLCVFLCGNFRVGAFLHGWSMVEPSSGLRARGLRFGSFTWLADDCNILASQQDCC